MRPLVSSADSTQASRCCPVDVDSLIWRSLSVNLLISEVRDMKNKDISVHLDYMYYRGIRYPISLAT